MALDPQTPILVGVGPIVRRRDGAPVAAKRKPARSGA